ncbi:MAG: hypothetical protein WBL07_01415 [Thiothrix litoralis]
MTQPTILPIAQQGEIILQQRAADVRPPLIRLRGKPRPSGRGG